MRKITCEEVKERLIKKNPNLYNITELPNGDFQASCSKCGGHPVFSRSHALMADTSCSVCYGRVTEAGINDLQTTDPEIAKYFTDDNYVKTHSLGTHIKGETECPVCHNKQFKLPLKIKEKGYSCHFCSDGISYPNKFARQLLLQLPISNLICEYSPEWAGLCRYDAYFEYDGKKFVLELDGMQHYVLTNKLWKDPIEQKEIDLKKDSLAKEHGLIMIRVNCYTSELTYIKDSILNSDLNLYFDLTKIDWAECEKYARSNVMKSMCLYFNEHEDCDVTELSKLFNVARGTARRYLRMGTDIGWCHYDKEESIKKRNAKVRAKLLQKYGRHMNVYDENGVWVGYFENSSSCVETLNQLYPDKHFTTTSISAVLCNKAKHHQGFSFISA